MNLSNQMPLQALQLAQAEWLEQRTEFLKDWYKTGDAKKYADGNRNQVEQGAELY